jgi:hypothetical protein
MLTSLDLARLQATPMVGYSDRSDPNHPRPRTFKRTRPHVLPRTRRSELTPWRSVRPGLPPVPAEPAACRPKRTRTSARPNEPAPARPKRTQPFDGLGPWWWNEPTGRRAKRTRATRWIQTNPAPCPSKGTQMRPGHGGPSQPGLGHPNEPGCCQSKRTQPRARPDERDASSPSAVRASRVGARPNDPPPLPVQTNPAARCPRFSGHPKDQPGRVPTNSAACRSKRTRPSHALGPWRSEGARPGASPNEPEPARVQASFGRASPERTWPRRPLTARRRPPTLEGF